MDTDSLIAGRYNVFQIIGHTDGATIAWAMDQQTWQPVVALKRMNEIPRQLRYIPGILTCDDTVSDYDDDDLDTKIFRDIGQVLSGRPAPWPADFAPRIRDLLRSVGERLASEHLGLAHSALGHIAVRNDGDFVLLDPPLVRLPHLSDSDLLEWQIDMHCDASAHWGAFTDAGDTRVLNEDTWARHRHLAGELWICADGLGGFQAGELGVRLALRAAMGVMPCADPIAAVLDRAEREFHVLKAKHDQFAGAGAAVVAAWILHGVAHIGWVGDCRAWLVRGGLRPLTRDHSLIEKMLQEGKISLEEAVDHPHRNILLRSLGVAPGLEIERKQVALQPGDRLVLTTDGVHAELQPAEMTRILDENKPPNDAAKALVLGGVASHDNGAAVVIDIA